MFIFGGEVIYKLFLPFVKKLYITKLHHHFEGDKFFPQLNDEEWNKISVEKE
jgi:dihydrofolate reductase (trimethoprim resistance protein)